MNKIDHLVGANWSPLSHPSTYESIGAVSGTCVVAGVSGGDVGIMKALAACLKPPYLLLYILHSPRGEAEAGRFQSGWVEQAELETLLDTFADLLGRDARHDFWIHSPEDEATLIWDRHDLLYAYGPHERYEAALHARGFRPGKVSVPGRRALHTHAELDGQSAKLLRSLDWTRSDLEPGDEAAA